MISRRTLLTIPFATGACRRASAGFRGYAFVANEEGGAIAAVDLEALAVAKHIPVGGSPSQVLVDPNRPAVYVLTPDSGTVHEIQADQLRIARKFAVARAAVQMELAGASRAPLYVLAREPRALFAVEIEGAKTVWRLSLPEDPVELAIAGDAKTAAVTSRSSVRLIHLETRQVGSPLGSGDYGAVRFLSDDRTLIAADRGARRLSLYDVASSRLITHLPLAVRPDSLCFNQDGGQLFVTGEGMDGVVVVYPYHTPEVAETVLAGRGPGPMAVSASLLFVTNPQSGAVSIVNIGSRKLIAEVQVGSDPGFIAVTPDDQFALVLNRRSGDVAVLRVGRILANANRFRTGALLTVIPVGSKPVSAAVRAIV